MSGLYPTPSRLRLWRDIKAGRVRHEGGDAYTADEYKVTYKVLESMTCVPQLVVLGGRADDAGRDLYEVTAACERVLAAHPEATR